METLNIKRNNKLDKGCNAASNNNNNMSNAANQTAAKAEREEKVRSAVAAFIIRERQRKKEEFEAKVEEVRQRKEREARERQNAMTLEETRVQISKLEKRLFELHNQKQQLFLQLKKVLNEDEMRKKQQKDNEIMAMQAAQAQQASVPQPQVFLPPVRVQHHQMPIITKPVNNPPIKRGRSPSPTQQGYYKNTGYSQPKHDEGRRGVDYARVLWNKPHTTYQSPGTLFYQTTSSGPPPPQQSPDTRNPSIIYTPYNLPLRQGYHLELPCTSAGPVSKADQKTTYIVQTTAGGGNIVQTSQQQKPQITMEKINDRYHVEVKHEGPQGHCPPPSHQLPEDVVYIPGMTLHPNVMQISGAPPQNSKTGVGISQAYAPSRGSGVPHESQITRQQQLTVIPGGGGQPGGQQPPQQPMHYQRRMF